MHVAEGPVICFDLGGVLARIRRSWGACASAEGLSIQCPETADLSSFGGFDDYQHGLLDDAVYVTNLAAFLGVDEAAAVRVHDAILQAPYEGVEDLVSDLKAMGLRTACLSNTNSLHWRALDSPRFAAIHALDLKLTSHDTKLLKPDERMFQAFEEFSGRTGSQIVYFDDHDENVRASKLRGWQSFLVDPFGDPAAQMKSELLGLGILDR